MATPCRVAFFVMRRYNTTPRTGGGPRQPPNLPTKGRGRPNTTPRPHNSTRHHPATAQQHSSPPRDRITALITTPRPHNSTCQQPAKFCSSAKKYCEKCCSFKKISYFCSLKANRKIVKMRCKTTHFLMLTPATAWVGIFIS